MQQLTFLPNVIQIDPYASPGAALRGGMVDHPPEAIASVLTNVRNRKIVRCDTSNSTVYFRLDNGADFYVVASLRTPQCELVYEPIPHRPELLLDSLGSEVMIDWSNIGLRVWKRFEELEQMVSRTIDHVACHDFGVSVYLSGKLSIIFSAKVEATSGRPILFWGET